MGETFAGRHTITPVFEAECGRIFHHESVMVPTDDGVNPNPFYSKSRVPFRCDRSGDPKSIVMGERYMPHLKIITRGVEIGCLITFKWDPGGTCYREISRKYEGEETMSENALVHKPKNLWEVVIVNGDVVGPITRTMAGDDQEAILRAGLKQNLKEEDLDTEGVQVFARPFRPGHMR